MSAHTPGPWRYAPTNSGHMIAGLTPGYLAEVRDCGSGDVRANARLIAAAPSMLAALRAMAGVTINAGTVPGSVSPALNLALTAIKQAEGGAP